MGKQAAQNVPNIMLQDVNEAVFQLLWSSHRNEYHLCNFHQSPYNPTFTDLVSSEKRVPLPSIISPVTIYRLDIWTTVKAVIFISTVTVV